MVVFLSPMTGPERLGRIFQSRTPETSCDAKLVAPGCRRARHEGVYRLLQGAAYAAAESVGLAPVTRSFPEGLGAPVWLS